MKSFLFLIIVFSCNRGYSQHVKQGIKLVHYVFDEFSPGTVKMKSGETSNQVLNYNILTNEMIFDNEGKYIPLNNKFYEVLIASGMPLLLEFSASVSEPGTSTGYGGTSSTTASTSL
jgi:hypothetical protein